MKKVVKIISDVVVALIMVLAILMTIIVISSTRSEAKVPNLFGNALMSVQSDSMDAPEGFAKGSLIVVKLTSKEESNNLKIGDVITFLAVNEENNEAYYDTHRIVAVELHGGINYYTTQGDNTVTFDKYPVSSEGIIGVWNGTAIPKLGSVMDFLRSQLGFMICVVIPMAIFFVWQLYKFIAIAMENKKQKAVAAVSDAEDEIKQKAIAEYLAQQEKAKQAADSQAAKTDDPEQQAPPQE